MTVVICVAKETTGHYVLYTREMSLLNVQLLMLLPFVDIVFEDESETPLTLPCKLK